MSHRGRSETETEKQDEKNKKNGKIQTSESEGKHDDEMPEKDEGANAIVWFLAFLFPFSIANGRLSGP